MNNTATFTFQKLDKISDDKVSKVLDIMVECFSDAFRKITKSKDVLRRIFETGFDKSFVTVCLKDDVPAGFIAISNNKSRPLHFDKEILKKEMGKFAGAMTASSVNSSMGKPMVKGNHEGYIDFLGVNPEFRKMGVATALFNYTYSTHPYKTYYIDVVYNNEPAINLYKKLGYSIIKEKKGFIQIVSGLKCEYFMKYNIPESEIQNDN